MTDEPDERFERRPLRDERLGSLTQQSRGKKLTTARRILFFVGIVSILANLYYFVAAKDEVRKEIDKELAKQGGRQALQFQQQGALKELEDHAVQVTKLAALIFIGVGVAFVLFGAMIYRYPVPITIMALILYIASNAVTAVFAPEMLASGAIIKIIIIVALAKSIQAAIAYEDERKKALQERDRFDDPSEEYA